MASLTVLFPNEEESLSGFQQRIAKTSGNTLVIFSFLEELLCKDKNALLGCIEVCAAHSGRVRIANRKRTIVTAARARGIRVIDRAEDLRKLLSNHPKLDDALREFSPHLWKQQLRSRLQRIGLLSLPRLRIWILILLSAGLFFFVFFKLLPSSTIYVWPREDTISQTANIFLIQSGATLESPTRVTQLDLLPIVVRVDRTITFNDISKEFIGNNAVTMMTIVNEATESYSLKKGTRLINQAGMIFRVQEPILVDIGDSIHVKAIADPLDLYGEILGDRGNVPEGVRWDFPGLSQDERKVVYATNTTEATGGTTDYRTVLSKDDLTLARAQLEQELLTEAKQLVDEQREILNSKSEYEILELLYYEELTSTEYVEFIMPDQFLGEPVLSIPIEGSILYTAYAYDTQEVLDLLSRQLRMHVGEGKRLLEKSLILERLVAHVIDYDDEISWIKLTVDLSGTEQYILDTLSPTGAKFAKKVRTNVTGIPVENALRIVQNFPEVEKVEIKPWPPWTRSLPVIPSHIVVEPVTE